MLRALISAAPGLQTPKGKVTKVEMPGYSAVYTYDSKLRNSRLIETIDGVTYTTSTLYDEGSRPDIVTETDLRTAMDMQFQ